LVRHLVLGIEPQFPKYPVCVECKQRLNSCVLDMGMMCLGPVTRAGCNAVCPRNRLGCWGCRGPSEEANFESLIEILREKGFRKAMKSKGMQVEENPDIAAFRARVANLKDMDLYSDPRVNAMLLKMLKATQ